MAPVSEFSRQTTNGLYLGIVDIHTCICYVCVIYIRMHIYVYLHVNLYIYVYVHLYRYTQIYFKELAHIVIELTNLRSRAVGQQARKSGRVSVLRP